MRLWLLFQRLRPLSIITKAEKILEIFVCKSNVEVNGLLGGVQLGSSTVQLASEDKLCDWIDTPLQCEGCEGQVKMLCNRIKMKVLNRYELFKKKED